MGFFSWNAAIEPGSKKQSAVMNAHTDECRPVWWYFPKHMDAAPLCEEAYDGYGRFGVSSYGELLYQMNEEHIAKKYGAAVLGALNHGLDDFGFKYYEDAAGRRWYLGDRRNRVPHGYRAGIRAGPVRSSTSGG